MCKPNLITSRILVCLDIWGFNSYKQYKRNRKKNKSEKNRPSSVGT